MYFILIAVYLQYALTYNICMLYIVPTPIGNLGDMTFRAVEVLKSVDVIIAENPTHTLKLLNYFKLPKKPLKQFADHNEHKVVASLLKECENKVCALVSDAGTPGISDPGFRLVRACVQAGIKVESLPGACAATVALAGSGLPTDRFLFLGFLGKTEHKVRQAIGQAIEIEATAVAYESPQRLIKSLTYIAKYFPTCHVVLARELTKLHEEYIRGTPQEALKIILDKPSVKGEIVLLVSVK